MVCVNWPSALFVIRVIGGLDWLALVGPTSDAVCHDVMTWTCEKPMRTAIA